MLNKCCSARTKYWDSSMLHHAPTCGHSKNPAQHIVFFNIYFAIVVTCLSINTVNSNTANMNRNFNTKSVKYLGSKQNDAPDTNYEDHDTSHTDVNFDTNPYYNSESFLHLNTKFYNNENNAYSNYEDYKKYYLNPSNPIPKSNVKFKISSRIVQTKYGKLQGIVLAMDEHRYLSPLEVFLGVPYATPPVGSNR